MKVQIIKCKTCGMVFSAHIDKYVDEYWYKQCAKYIKTGNAIIETIESVGTVFSDAPLNKCCGKKV
jgi:DNA-directed RNA polymerase subunit N (RpoN/RPB10)